MKTARQIADAHIGKYPDQNNRPTWDEIRESLAEEIKHYAINVVADALDRGAIKGMGGEIVTP